MTNQNLTQTTSVPPASPVNPPMPAANPTPTTTNPVPAVPLSAKPPLPEPLLSPNRPTLEQSPASPSPSLAKPIPTITSSVPPAPETPQAQPEPPSAPLAPPEQPFTPPTIEPPITSPNVTFSSGFTQHEAKSEGLMALLKIIYIIIIMAFLIVASVYLTKRFFKKSSSGTGEILMTTNYQPVLWKDFGEVFEPMIKVPIFYPNKGYNDENFLLDSGAVVSSLPRERADKLGFSLAKLPRSTFGGFGGTTSFAYKADVKIKLGHLEVTIPVVFTEAGGTKSILGRSGFFQDYSVYFNSKDEMIEIRK